MLFSASESASIKTLPDVPALIALVMVRVLLALVYRLILVLFVAIPVIEPVEPTVRLSMVRRRKLPVPELLTRSAATKLTLLIPDNTTGPLVFNASPPVPPLVEMMLPPN